MLEGQPSRAPAMVSWRARVRSTVDGVRHEPRRLVTVVVLAAVVVALLWWLFRAPAVPDPEVTLPRVSSTVGGGASGASPASPTTTAVRIVVHVAGAVARPGVLRLPDGARVVDAVDAAGGFATDADPSRVNLAAKVADGQRVYVPRIGEATPVDAALSGPNSTTPTGPVDLNTASIDELDRLPGIGPATAAAIVEHRSRNGAFHSVDELRDVPGIGEAKLAQLRPLVTV
jgi:competence protein ComEA